MFLNWIFEIECVRRGKKDASFFSLFPKHSPITWLTFRGESDQMWMSDRVSMIILSFPIFLWIFVHLFTVAHGDFTVCDFNDRDNDLFMCGLLTLYIKRDYIIIPMHACSENWIYASSWMSNKLDQRSLNNCLRIFLRFHAFNFRGYGYNNVYYYCEKNILFYRIINDFMNNNLL